MTHRHSSSSRSSVSGPTGALVAVLSRSLSRRAAQSSSSMLVWTPTRQTLQTACLQVCRTPLGTAVQAVAAAAVRQAALRQQLAAVAPRSSSTRVPGVSQCAVTSPHRPAQVPQATCRSTRRPSATAPALPAVRPQQGVPRLPLVLAREQRGSSSRRRCRCRQQLWGVSQASCLARAPLGLSSQHQLAWTAAPAVAAAPLAQLLLAWSRQLLLQVS